MKKQLKALAALGILGLTLSSCELLKALGGDGSCFTYSDESVDGFQMSINQSEFIMTPNQIATITLKQSWITIDYSQESKPSVRKDTTCRPAWTYSNPGVVEIDKESTTKLNALQPGLTLVTATAQGNSDITDSFWVLVNPPSNETASPNDTFALAKPAGTSVIGTISNSDLDFWKFTIPANREYRISLGTAIDIRPANGQFFASYAADFYNELGQAISSPTTDKLEGSNATAFSKDIYVRVTGNPSSDTPYRVSLELF